MTRFAFFLFGACLISAGCSLTDRGDSSPATAAPATTASEPVSAAPRADDERSVAIYAAVVRQVVTKDHTYGGSDPGFEVVYVLDGSLNGAGSVKTWIRDRLPEEPFSEAIKTGLEEKLVYLPDLVFVRDRASVLRRGGEVKNHGVLVSLGPIVGDHQRVEVGSNLWGAAKGAIWLRYVVKQRGSRWAVTGTTGQMAIS
jgi:hypothetical protein